MSTTTTKATTTKAKRATTTMKRMRTSTRTRTRPRKPVDPRVEVARDVIALLRMRRVKPTTGEYFTATLRHDQPSLAYTQVDIQRLLHGHNVEKCAVCAKGAMMLAFALKNDKALGMHFGSTVSVSEYMCSTVLSETFRQSALDIIERAFEGWDDQAWYRRYTDPTTRLRAIMQRIIDNGGEFSASEVP